MLSIILLIFALVLLSIAGIVNPVDPWRGKLACFGLACWVAAEIFRGVGPVLTK
jgi:cell division protein FtsW (lipid II flippase)